MLRGHELAIQILACLGKCAIRLANTEMLNIETGTQSFQACYPAFASQ